MLDGICPFHLARDGWPSKFLIIIILHLEANDESSFSLCDYFESSLRLLIF